MQIAVVGLGRMGANMVRRLVRGGHEVVATNRSRGPIDDVVQDGAIGAYTLEELVERLRPPRHIWLMLPAGAVTDEYLDRLMDLCTPGDLFVDGGNSKWKDTLARAERVKARGYDFVDAGTSGGVWGLEVGYCIMAGGSDQAIGRIAPVLTTLAPEAGWAHVGPNGAGHFVKMVHNGVEYGMMQAYAEGFEILQRSGFGLDLRQIADLWNHGSVVRSWLLELACRAFEEDPGLEKLQGYVQDTGEGRWTIEAAIDEDVPAPVIMLSLVSRFYSRDSNAFSWRVLAALRNQFGGHAVKSAEAPPES